MQNIHCSLVLLPATTFCRSWTFEWLKSTESWREPIASWKHIFYLLICGTSSSFGHPWVKFLFGIPWSLKSKSKMWTWVSTMSYPRLFRLIFRITFTRWMFQYDADENCCRFLQAVHRQWIVCQNLLRWKSSSSLPFISTAYRIHVTKGTNGSWQITKEIDSE